MVSAFCALFPQLLTAATFMEAANVALLTLAGKVTVMDGVPCPVKAHGVVNDHK